MSQPMQSVHEHKGRWWFWDSVWQKRKGPFATQKEAEEAQTKYAKYVFDQAKRRREMTRMGVRKTLCFFIRDISAEKHAKFKAWCARRGISMSTKLESLIEAVYQNDPVEESGEVR